MLYWVPVPAQTNWHRGHLTGKPIHHSKYHGEISLLVRAACIFPEARRAPSGPMVDWEPIPDQTSWSRGHLTGKPIHYPTYLGETSILVSAACILSEVWRAPRGPMLYWEPVPDQISWGSGHLTAIQFHLLTIIGEISVLVRVFSSIFAEVWRAPNGPMLYWVPVPDQTNWRRGHFAGKPIIIQNIMVRYLSLSEQLVYFQKHGDLPKGPC